MESQLGWHPNEDMNMSYAPSFRAPGGHIFDVVDQGLKKHVFTAMLAQHVASVSKLHTETVPAQHNTRHKANVRQTDGR